jgi:viologen exporter family transport system permease protein
VIQSARCLVAFSRAGFLRLLAYRLRYVTGILTYTINVAVYFFIWKAVYAHTAPHAMLRGFSLSDMLTYVALGWIIRSFYFNNIDREMATLVTEGHITNFLVRPVSLLHAMTGLAAGESLFRLTAFTGPITVVIFALFPLQGPADPAAFVAFLASVLLSFVIFAYINFLVGLVAFATRSITGLISAKHYTIQLLSGLLMPIGFFPDWLRTASEFLPFRHIAYTPAALYLGRYQDVAALQVLGEQLVWAVGLGLACRLAWGRMARHLVIQGG